MTSGVYMRSAETRSRMSETRRKMWASPEYRQKMREMFTEDVRRRISEGAKRPRPYMRDGWLRYQAKRLGLCVPCYEEKCSDCRAGVCCCTCRLRWGVTEGRDIKGGVGP